MSRWLANLIDRFLARISPLKDLDAADWLADLEAERDVFEPDELWAARMRHQTPAGTSRPRITPRVRARRNPLLVPAGPTCGLPRCGPTRNESAPAPLPRPGAGQGKETNRVGFQG